MPTRYFYLLLFVCLALPAVIYAAEGSVAASASDYPAPPPPDAALSGEDDAALQARAQALHEQATQQRSAAENKFTREHEACWDRFLVNHCRDQAKIARRDALAAARVVENEARRYDRELRRRNFVARQEELRLNEREREKSAQQFEAEQKKKAANAKKKPASPP